MKKDDLIYLDHILQSLTKVVEYLDGVSFESFMADEENRMPSFGKLK